MRVGNQPPEDVPITFICFVSITNRRIRARFATTAIPVGW